MSAEKTDRPRKIAILGAGPAGLTTAICLTDTPELREQNEVTIYQVGWRAGGKCRSGRVPPHNWVDLNGTHYLFGAYACALATVKHVYEGLEAYGDNPYGTFQDNLEPVNFVDFKHEWKGRVVDWKMLMASNRVEPGSPGVWWPVIDAVQVAVKNLFQTVFGWRMLNDIQWPDAWPPEGKRGPIGRLLGRVRKVLTPVFQFLGMGIVRLYVNVGDGLFGPRGALRATAWWMKFWRGFWRLLLGPFRRRWLRAYRLWVMVDYATTSVIGLVADRVDELGLESIDRFDYREWFRRHGGSDQLRDSPLVMNWYNAVASYECGDRKRPRIAAGVSVRALSRASLAYKGAFTYSLAEEVGDSVIGPMYQLLVKRGVRFMFFHDVRDLRPSPDGKTIDQVLVQRQVELESGDPATYDPLEPLERTDGPPLPVWPTSPRWSQISTKGAEGYDLESFYSEWRGGTPKVLTRGEDFDDLVYAMPVGMLPFNAPRLLQRHDDWRFMWQNVRGTDSQSLRLWLKPDLEGLGWPYPMPVVSVPAWPMTTWEDNTNLISGQRWPADDKPHAIASLFGTLPSPEFPPGRDDVGYPKTQHAVATDDGDHFLDCDVWMLWPDATSPTNPNGIDKKLLVLRETRSNTGPIDRYTQALPGATRYRFAADESSYRNLFLAGDWTRNGSYIGDVDGAVMSGLIASRRMCGHPRTIIGDPGF